jgi:regulator of nonsense transcripts 2
VKYLAELYNYQLVSTGTLLDTLYMLVTLGHPQGLPHPDHPSPLDPPQDFFRVRLICTILDTVRPYFVSGNAAKRMDQFLVYFQLYLICRETDAMPLDVSFLLEDTFQGLRPQLKRMETFGEAEIAVHELEKQAHILVDGEIQESDIRISSAVKSPRDEVVDEFEESAAGHDEDGDSEEDDDEDDDDEDSTDEEEETSSTDIAQTLPGPSAEEEQAFMQEFHRVLGESLESRRMEKKAVVLDVPIPMSLKSNVGSATASMEGVQFTLLAKKKSKQTTRAIDVPLESALAQSTLAKQDEQRIMDEQLKRRVVVLGSNILENGDQVTVAPSKTPSDGLSDSNTGAQGQRNLRAHPRK